jgi:3-oxoacyl-[acyl-carrier protein] reductase
MVALLAAPTVERRFDAPAAGRAWQAAELDNQLGRYFAERDPARTFACTDVLTLS